MKEQQNATAGVQRAHMHLSSSPPVTGQHSIGQARRDLDTRICAATIDNNKFVTCSAP